MEAGDESKFDEQRARFPLFEELLGESNLNCLIIYPPICSINMCCICTYILHINIADYNIYVHYICLIVYLLVIGYD